MKNAKLFLIVTFLALSAILSGCAGGATVASSWPGLAANQDTAFLAFNQHIFAVNLADGTEKWRFPAEPNNRINFYATPTLTENGQLLAGGFDNVLYSLDPSTGSQNWTFDDATNRYIGSPLVTDAGIFAPNADENLYALEPDGQMRWKFQTQRAQWAKPATDADCQCIYLPSMDHHVYSVDAQTGEQIWATEDLGGSVVGTPAYSEDGVLYVGSFGSEMLAIDAGTGQLRWEFKTNGWVWGGPILSEGALYFGDLSGTFYALNAENGEELWKIQPDGPVVESPLVTEDGIYFSTESGTLYALDFEGNNRWPPKTIGGKLYTSPVAAGDLILVAPTGIDQLIIALDAEGNQEWAFTPAED